MNLIILNAILYLIYSSFPAIYQGWPEMVLCVEDMQHLLILHYRNSDGGVVNGNLNFL